MSNKTTTEHKVFKFSMPEPNSGCWIWIGAVTNKKTMPYGKVFEGGKTRSAHRAAYEAFIGPVPNGLSVLHKCDTPLCVNPGHLYAGTHADNMRDMSARGRASRIGGTKKFKKRFSKTEAAKIRRLYAGGINQFRLARRFKTTQPTISHVITRKFAYAE